LADVGKLEIELADSAAARFEPIGGSTIARCMLNGANTITTEEYWMISMQLRRIGLSTTDGVAFGLGCYR